MKNYKNNYLTLITAFVFFSAVSFDSLIHDHHIVHNQQIELTEDYEIPENCDFFENKNVDCTASNLFQVSSFRIIEKILFNKKNEKSFKPHNYLQRAPPKK